MSSIANNLIEFDPLDLPDPKRWEPWKASDHPTIMRGRVVDKYRRWSDFDDKEQKNFADVLTKDGAVWTLSGYATRIHQELARVNPSTGDEIGVKFLGVVERTGKKPYPDVKIVNYSRPAASEVDFTPAAEEEDASPGADKQEGQGNESDVPY